MTWEELVGWHLGNPLAVVFKDKDYFVMGRGVSRHAAPEVIRDLTHGFYPAQCDAWFLFAFAGDMAKAVRLHLHGYAWVGWERYGSTEKELHWYLCARIREQLSPS